MKRAYLLFATLATAGLTLSWPAVAQAINTNEVKTGETTLIHYQGRQDWPTSKTAQIDKEYSVPIYMGLPDKDYTVIGRIVDQRQDGIELVGRAFDDAFDSQKHRLRNCANQAKRQGGDAVVVTDDERVLKALSLTTKQAKDSNPMVHQKRNVVLAIKF